MLLNVLFGVPDDGKDVVRVAPNGHKLIAETPRPGSIFTLRGSANIAPYLSPKRFALNRLYVQDDLGIASQDGTGTDPQPHRRPGHLLAGVGAGGADRGAGTASMLQSSHRGRTDDARRCIAAARRHPRAESAQDHTGSADVPRRCSRRQQRTPIFAIRSWCAWWAVMGAKIGSSSIAQMRWTKSLS